MLVIFYLWHLKAALFILDTDLRAVERCPLPDILCQCVVFSVGVLRLEQAQKEAVILACTMTNEAEATLFEIDVNSNFALTPVKDPMFPKTPIFLKTVSYCEDEAEAWRRQIKVTTAY